MLYNRLILGLPHSQSHNIIQAVWGGQNNCSFETISLWCIHAHCLSIMLFAVTSELTQNWLLLGTIHWDWFSVFLHSLKRVLCEGAESLAVRKTQFLWIKLFCDLPLKAVVMTRMGESFSATVTREREGQRENVKETENQTGRQLGYLSIDEKMRNSKTMH